MAGLSAERRHRVTRSRGIFHAASARSTILPGLLWAHTQISRRGASTPAVDAGTSAHPEKQLNLSCVAQKANGWFGTAFIVGDAESALGGFEPILGYTAMCTKV